MRQSNAPRGAAQGVLERNFQGLFHVLPTLRARSGAPAAAKQILENRTESVGEAPSRAKNIADVTGLKAAESAAPRVERLVSEAVVFRAILAAAQHLVRL